MRRCGRDGGGRRLGDGKVRRDGRCRVRLGLLPFPLRLQRPLDGLGDLLLRAVPLVRQRLLVLVLLRRRLGLAALPLLDLPGAHAGPGLALALHGREVRQLGPAIAVPVGDVFRLHRVELLKFAHAALGPVDACLGLLFSGGLPGALRGEPVEIRRQLAAVGFRAGEPLAQRRPDPGRLLAALPRRRDLLFPRPLGLGELGGLAGGGVLRPLRRVLLRPARALGGRGHDLEIHAGGRPPFRRILRAADILEAAGVERGHGMAVLVDEPRRPRPLGLHLVPVPPQGRRAVHRAIGAHGPSRGQHVEVRLRPVLVMAVHVDHGDGLVAALLPVVDERLGARRPLLRRALRRQLDDLVARMRSPVGPRVMRAVWRMRRASASMASLSPALASTSALFSSSSSACLPSRRTYSAACRAVVVPPHLMDANRA